MRGFSLFSVFRLQPTRDRVQIASVVHLDLGAICIWNTLTLGRFLAGETFPVKKKTPALPKQCRVNFHAPGETRTPNLLIRSQMLYPIELRAPIPTSDLLGEPAIESSTRSESSFLLYGRYKTRTCDLHDVNVAL